MPSTASPPANYVGRFAPSPTGPLHLGSLVAALASFLDARQQQGKWLVRIEDIDPPREQPGASSEILKALEAHQLLWDDSVLYQSQRSDLYRSTALKLIEQHQAYYCSCSRQQLKGQPVYPGTCRQLKQPPTQPAATRIIAQDVIVSFDDRIQGPQRHHMASEIGDFVIFRKDGLVAYQLATALDDHLQGITHVVRGSDLLDSTPRQIYLHQVLGLGSPYYSHIPVLAHANGQKLSKQNLATPLNLKHCQQNLFQSLIWLNQQPPAELLSQPTSTLLDWAIKNWSIDQVPVTGSIQID